MPQNERPETLREFLAWVPPVTKELIGFGVLEPESGMFLQGPYKSWKSMSAMDLAFKLATGEPWLGIKTVQCRVLLVQLEINKRAYQKRVTKYALGNKLSPLENLHLHSTKKLKLDKSWGIAMLEQWISQTKAEVVIIDDLYKIYSGRLSDDYDARQLTDKLDELMDKYHVAIVIVHHEGKDVLVEGEVIDRGADAGFGSAVFGWWCDSKVRIRVQSDDGRSPHVRLRFSFDFTRNAEYMLRPTIVDINRTNLVFTNIGEEDNGSTTDES